MNTHVKKKRNLFNKCELNSHYKKRHRFDSYQHTLLVLNCGFDVIYVCRYEQSKTIY